MLQNVTKLVRLWWGLMLLVVVGQMVCHVLDVHLWCPSSIHSSQLGMKYLGFLFVSAKQTSHLVTFSDVAELAEK